MNPRSLLLFSALLGAVAGLCAEEQAPEQGEMLPRYTEAETPSAKDDQPMGWQLAPKSITDLRTPASAIAVQRHFSGDYTEVKGPTPLTAQIPEIDNQLSQLDPFFRDTSLIMDIRSQFFRTENESGPLASAWALGGNVLYKSGWFKDFLLVGAGYYSSNGLYKPNGQGGTLLLKNQYGGGQANIHILGQAYAEFKVDIYHAKFYRQAISTPFINEHYDRMIPQLFEAYLIGTKGLQAEEKGMGLKDAPENPVNFLAGYVAEELNRGTTAFTPMSSVATRNTTPLDRGVVMGGIQVTPTHQVGLSLWEYYGVDMFNTLYGEAEFDLPIDDDWAAKFAIQFADQRSVGDEIVGDWAGQMVGLLAGASYRGLSFSFRFNHDFNGVGTEPNGAPKQFGINSPWGRYPGFNKSTVQNFNNAQSPIYGAWLAYDFGFLSPDTEGLKFATSYVFADRKDSITNGGPDEAEFDLILQYDIPHLKGLYLEARGSWVSFYEQGAQRYVPAINDYRFTLNYSLPLL